MKSTVSWLKTRKRNGPPPEIEDVQEPFCGQYRQNMTCLSDYDPLIAAEWFYEKNCGWGPEDFSHGSNVKAWWQCQYCLRVYKATICNRVGNQSACPYCASKKICRDNALSHLFPEIAKEWHPSKNGKLKATSVMRASAKRAWWLCSVCKYEWETAIYERTFSGAGCPGCYRARIVQKANHVKAERKPIILGETIVPQYDRQGKKYDSLAKSYPEVAKQWHPTGNGAWTPQDFSMASGVKAWWKCQKGADHEWQDTISNRTKSKRGCPFCAGRRVSKTNSLQTLFPKVAKEWHQQRNGKITPDAVTSGSDKRVWWQCSRFPDHEWETDIYSRARSGTGCPHCSHKKVSRQNNLRAQFPYIAMHLHPTKNGELTGDQIAAKSHKKVWWICKKGPDHEWLASPNTRTAKGSGCPFCVGQKISITNCLQTLRPDLARLWDKKKNGKLTPTDVTISSKLVVWWRCKYGHSWQQKVCYRTKAVVECHDCLGK